MTKDFHQKKSLKEFSDRELLLFILANQANLYRQTQYIMKEITNAEEKHVGLYKDTFKELIQDVDDFLKQADKYLDQEDEDKGFIKF